MKEIFADCNSFLQKLFLNTLFYVCKKPAGQESFLTLQICKINLTFCNLIRWQQKFFFFILSIVENKYNEKRGYKNVIA